MELEEEVIVTTTAITDDTSTNNKECPSSQSQLDSVKELLDEVEEQIEAVRNQAEQLVEEKEDIQTTLDMLTSQDQLQHLNEVDREEVKVMVDRLNSRLSALQVNINTARSTSQQESLHSVNKAIDTLIFQIQTDTVKAQLMCSQYLSATGADINHPADIKFEQHLLGCTAEDQKCVKKRLLGLLDHIKVLASDNIQEETAD
eukprot:TRINITY_DN5449_c0_g1_i7.p1 TRINITY_DN5449_c0_g1~~TRINITY_DN5449_c0_g1_i7.p1  ORF type:complete len:217 (-),score=75.01 TRINITY_DN5449_c0_g1_i7:117-722(-)